MSAYKITYGGWYQRTTLHLTEVYNFFAFAFTQTSLSKEKLKKLQDSLDLVSVTREIGYLEFVKGVTKSGIEIRYYEDGLYILSLVSSDIKTSQQSLEEYFEEVFNPALAYLFSLGAPTPKVLANIRTLHPTVVTITGSEPDEFQLDVSYGAIYSQITSDDVAVLKTRDYIFVVSKKEHKNLADLVDMQIFFREYKDQLEKYLNIHRKIWEEIEDIKDRKQIKGSDLNKIREKLDRYQKTVSLISNRIVQMESYAHSRQKIASELHVEAHLDQLFQYKFDTLSDSRSYIEELWVMTSNYLSSAIEVVVELKNQSTKDSISSLTVITTIGVVAAILTYMTRDSFPKFTAVGIIFFVLLVILTTLVNKFISYYFKNRTYKLTIGEVDKKI